MIQHYFIRQQCNNGLGECVPYYLCVNGTINTDGSDLLDIRLGETEEECVDYFEQCCATGDVLSEPVRTKPGSPVLKVHSECGFRNVEGVGFRIIGNNDNEAEYGEFPWMVAILKEEIAGDQVLNVYQCGGSLIHPGVILTGKIIYYWQLMFSNFSSFVIFKIFSCSLRSE